MKSLLDTVTDELDSKTRDLLKASMRLKPMQPLKMAELRGDDVKVFLASPAQPK